MKRPPKLCRNKHRNFAYITLGGKQIYLGKWGSAEAQAVGLFVLPKSKLATQVSVL
jgi:hypothetical protein